MKIYLLLAVLLGQWVALSGQSCLSDSLKVRSIEASETDSNIGGEVWEHQVFYNSDCVPNDLLVLHLVGSFDNPANTTYFPSLAANRGFKAINLKYRNEVSANGACALSSDMDCYEKYREEIIFGTDVSSQVSVDSNECILNRLLKLLVHLDSLYPLENWDHFLAGSDSIDWSDIVLSGHSQGGGHAAFIAKQFEVERVLMFASPNDFSPLFSAPAPWLSVPGLTPDSNHFAFGNLFDEVVDFEKQYQNWGAMNLMVLGDSVLVDNSSCPYNASRILYTEDTSATGVPGPFHNSVVIDNFTPLVGGVPVFTPVWEYMLGLCPVSTSVLDQGIVPEGIRVFPNPARSRLNLHAEKAIAEVEVYNLSGKLLTRLEPFKNEVSFSLEPASGLLILRIRLLDGRVQVLRVLVE